MGTLLAVTLLMQLAATDDAAREEAACRLAAANEAVEDARATTVALLGVLKDGTTAARTCAATALGRIAPGVLAADPELARRVKNEAVPVLVLGLDQRGEMCRAAADTLGLLGPLAADAVPHLEEKLANESCAKQALHAESALQRIKTGG